MDSISDVTVGTFNTSKYIKPVRLYYKQNGKEHIWDTIKVHDSVAILLFNISRNVFVFVKQFRPAIYINRVEAELALDESLTSVDTTRFPGSMGITHELCAGVMDKDSSPKVVAQEEIIEECGFKVALESIEKITSFRNGVGTTGSLQTLFYAEVTDVMKVGPGGGLVEEGEFIEVDELPVSEGKQFVMDESKIKPVGMMFALMWFYENKWPKITTT